MGKPPSSTARPALEARLRHLLGDRLTDSQALRDQYRADEGHHLAPPPDLVAFPRDSGEVAEILTLCAAARCPVVARGAGTSLEGNALASSGGVLLDTAQMAAIIEVRPDDMIAIVEPGVRRKQ